MKKFFKKEYLLLIFIFIMVLSTIIIKPLGDLDELWNYNVARNIADGKVPYRDISTITTPLLPFVNSIFLKLISNELITMRVLAAVLCTGILYMIFKILKIVTKETNFSMIVVILIGWLFKDLYCIDYNYMVLFLTLIILYLELKESKSFIIGFLAGLAICTKQSIGAVVAVATMLEPLILIHKKDDIKKAIKEIGKRLLGMAIPIIILFAYLLITNTFQDFISYAVQGISTFDNHVEYTHLFKSRDTEIAILSKVMPISVVATIIASIVTKFTSKKFQDETKTKFNYLQKMTLYSLPILIVMYPIADKIHFVIGITIALLVSCYCIFLLGNVVYDKITYTKPPSLAASGF